MIAPWICARLDRHKAIVARIVSHRAACANEIGIEWRRMIIARVLIAASRDIGKRLGRRRRRTEYNRHAECARAYECEIARGITQPLLLLVRGIVLFIDYDQAGVRKRSKDGRARTDDHLRITMRGGEPRACTFAFGKSRMQCEYFHTEPNGRPWPSET